MTGSRLRRARAGIAAALTLFAASVSALETPPMNGPVNDLAGILTPGAKQELSGYLAGVNSQTGVQVAVLTIPSLEGESIESFSVRTAEAWKLGQKDIDNGVLLVVALADRAIRIEVGYGLEGSLTDMKCGLIIRTVIAPAFRNGDYSTGIIEAVRSIVGIATDNVDIVSESVRNPPPESANGSVPAAFLFMFFFIMFMLIGIGRRNRGRGMLGPIIAGKILSDIMRSGSRDSWGGHSGGGGFGGFSGGGGSFGGGGASGGW